MQTQSILAILAATLALSCAASARAEIDWNPFAHDLYGSLQYGTSMVEIGGLVGQSPFTGEWGAGFHYQERGSLLAQLAFGASSAAGAGFRAQQTGQDQVYYVDQSPVSSAGLSVDLLTGDADSFVFELFYGIPVGSDRLPWVIDIGVTLAGAGDDDLGWFGLELGLIAPVTPLAQIEANVRATVGSGPVSGDVHLVGNLTNRFYVRLGGRYVDQFTVDAGVGVKL